jgi:hypothetical protein
MIRLTPIKAIRAKCLDCTGNQPKEVRLCTCLSCPLWGYRMGVRPDHTRALEANEEVEREKLRDSHAINCSNGLATNNGLNKEKFTLQKILKITERY